MNIADFALSGIGAPAADDVVIATATEIARAGVPFLWLGSALAILFLEISLSLRLGICQRAFRALNVSEVVLATVLAVAVLADADRSLASVVLVVALWLVLGWQVVVLRPRLDSGSSHLLVRDGAPRLLFADTGPRTQVHASYVKLEIVKLVGLAVLGCVLITGVTG